MLVALDRPDVAPAGEDAEALIEEARQRQRRRRQVVIGVLAALALVVGLVLALGHGGGGVGITGSRQASPHARLNVSPTSATRKVGACVVTVSVTTGPTDIEANGFPHGALSVLFRCPGFPNPLGGSETLPGDMRGVSLIETGGGGAAQDGAWRYRSIDYLSGDARVAVVRLVQMSTGKAVASVQPVWEPALSAAVAPLIALGPSQQGLQVQAVTASGHVLADAPWVLPQLPKRP